MDERIQTVFDALRTVLRERCLGALPESVFETSCNMSHVFHPASSSGASALGFVLMIIPPHLVGSQPASSPGTPGFCAYDAAVGAVRCGRCDVCCVQAPPKQDMGSELNILLQYAK